MNFYIGKTYLAFMLGLGVAGVVHNYELRMHDAGWWVLIILSGVVLAFLNPDRKEK